MAITFYATNNFTGNGSTTVWNINFADGYLDSSDVKARYLADTGDYVDIAVTSVAGNVVTITPAQPAGRVFQIYRDTEKAHPLVDFTDGAILNELSLDTLARQAVMVSAEAFDRSTDSTSIAGNAYSVAIAIDGKAQEALDNSDVAIATANAIDGKAQMALDSSADAVSTANAAASDVVGAVNTANTALVTANGATDDAATAITAANAAVVTANAATTTANAASAAATAATTTANNAADDADAAVSTAGTALSTANTASTNASTAVATANDAKTTAEGIETKADSALAASANAVTTANAAEATANAIDGKATTAINTANSAVTTANDASAKADSAIATANAATVTANSATATANAIDGKAQEALDEVAALDSSTLKKGANLSDLANRAASWLNVRPVGSTPLAGDPVGDYDAATKRWVENLIGAGVVGPTMNGVMNFGVGDTSLWHSRAYIPPYVVVADGQLLNRAAWPELWAHAQMHSPVTDTVWLATADNRAKYSSGNGTTTFRVPDLNGVQSGSVGGLYGRGAASTGAYSVPGRVLQSALPNITGLMKVSGGAGGLDGMSGAFSVVNPGGSVYGPTSTSPESGSASFDASRSSSVYGRYTTQEVIPNSFVGVWVIRASGGFVAANTQWSVRNADSTLPPTSTLVRGGYVRSEYLVNQVLNHVSSFSTYNTVGGTDLQRGAEILTGSASYKFTDAGTAQATNWSSTSDPRVKSLVEVIPDPLNLMRSMRGYSWFYEHTGSKGFGFLSSEVKGNFPGAVNTFGDATLPDGTVVKDVEGVDTSGVSAALHHEAILALMVKVEALEARISELTS